MAAAAVGVRALLSALEARDNSTGKHSTAVAELVQVTARGMGLADGEVAHAGQIALMHDIGKVGIPDAILHKPGPLTQSDWRVMRRHPEIGERIVASVGALAHLAPAVRAEHERWDGDGYPDGLRGAAIPLSSRLVFACDAYEAMIAERPYRAAMAPENAVVELEANAGSQFDPAVVTALVGCLVAAGDVRATSTESARAAADSPAQPADTAVLTSPASAQPPPGKTKPRPRGAQEGDEPLAIRDVDDFDGLYRRSQPMVYRYCLGMLRTPEAAADAAQSTWERAMAAFSNPETVVRNVRPWLRAIARNECLDVLRAGGAVQTQDISTLELSTGTMIDDSYEIREQLKSLVADLHTLSERQRSAIVLRELCGLSSHELADELQTSRTRASGLVADARRTLTQRRAAQQPACSDARRLLHLPSAPTN